MEADTAAEAEAEAEAEAARKLTPGQGGGPGNKEEAPITTRGTGAGLKQLPEGHVVNLQILTSFDNWVPESLAR